nr:unnamed protein product [Callosobruchus analis]
MEQALKAYREKLMGFNECCRTYTIPKPTFRRHLLSLNKNANENIIQKGRMTIFNKNVEHQLEQHILNLEARLFGVTITDVRRLAFQIAEQNNIRHNFNKETGMAGKAWYYAFMKRHKNLSLRLPEKVSMARAAGFNEQNVNHFFDLLEKLVDKEGFNALTVYNVDESGFSTVQKRNQKIIARKGKHQVGGISSGERGVNTTVICCANAAGQCIPPIIIYKRKRMAIELKTGAPPGAIVTTSGTGYINSELFLAWLRHFIETVKPSQQKKALLLLDGHTTHSKNLNAILLAREHGVVLLQLPGHTTNRLQPLDVSLFKPMENYFIKAVERFLHTNPGVPVSQYNMTPLLNEAYANAASIATIENGFRRAGIWPVDRAVFSQADFVPAALLLETTPPLVSQVQMEVGLNVSIEEILPLPENRPTLKRRKRCQPAVVLSSTPYKNDLHKKQTETSSKNNKKSQACSMKRNLSTVLSESTSLTSSNLGNIQTSVDIEVDPADWYCFMCEDNMIEDMVQCMKCKSWAHSKCAGKGKKLKKYICVNWA